ncbi:MAG TPA: twin-arginine translocase TatA/TatE family subunit [Croceibacterium sp.]|nr:twin-arginine translocase TatA/TatE family subunit [Croceibacterium sp.]
MTVGPFQILIIVLVLLALFGRGRVSEAMGDFGKGVKRFRGNLVEDETGQPIPALEADAESNSAHDSTL